MAGEVTEDEMRHSKRAYLAVTLFATFMGSAAGAAPATGSAFSNRLNADSSLDGPWSAGVQLAVIFGDPPRQYPRSNRWNEILGSRW